MSLCKELEKHYHLPKRDVYTEYGKGGYTLYYSYSRGCLLAKEHIRTGKIILTGSLTK